MPQAQRPCPALQRNSNRLLASLVIYLLVAEINGQCIYGNSESVVPEKPVHFSRGHELVVFVPKYNLKITATTKNDGHAEGPHANGLCNCDACSKAYREAYQREQDSQTPEARNELVPVEQDAAAVPVYFEAPAAYRQLAHTTDTVFTSPSQAQSAYDPVVGSARSAVHKHKQDAWDYSAPTWISDTSANMNILRSPDPRATIESHSKFVKVKNKHFGNSFVHHHSHSAVKTKPIIVRPVHKHGGVSIHKHTNIHVNKFRGSEEMAPRAATRLVDNRFVGSHIFAAPRWRRDTLVRKKRGVLEFLRLVGDHEAKLDVGKTAENVGMATKNVFESDKSPVYHLRNMVGSSNDAVMSMIGARPRGVLIPSRYRVVSANEAPIVGAISPELYSQEGQVPDTTDEDEQHAADQYYEAPNYGTGDQCPGRSVVANDDAFSRVGAILRDSIQQTHKTAEHVADAVHSAREVVASARRYWPKMVLPYAGAVEVTKKGKGPDIVGSAQDPRFVGIGRIMDYFGVTDVKPESEPRLGAPRRITEEERLLNNARASLGTGTYRQFMEKMKKELGKYQRLQPVLTNTEQVGSRLIPVKPRPLLARIPRPVYRPLPLNPNIYRPRASLSLPRRPVLKPIRRLPNRYSPILREPLKVPPKPDVKTSLANIREALKIPPKPEITSARVPTVHQSLLSLPKAEAKERPVLTKLRESLKVPSKAEPKPEKPVSPALAKLRESIALRKAVKKSPLVGKSRGATKTKDNDGENSEESKEDSMSHAGQTSTHLDYTEEDLDKSELGSTNVEPKSHAIITSPNLDDSEEAKHDAEAPLVAAQPKEAIITSPHLDDSEENADTSSADTRKDPGNPLQRLRAKLEDKYGKPPRATEHGDLLGRALEILRDRAKAKPKPQEHVAAVQAVTTPPANPDDVDNNLGAAAHDTGDMKFAAVPVPIFTKEMKTPFMGFASKTDLDDYFKNLYCAECKKARDADVSAS